MSETDYQVSCNICDEEDVGTNSYQGTLVLDGELCIWECCENVDRRYTSPIMYLRIPTEGKLSRKQQRITGVYKRKDYPKIREAILKAIEQTRKEKYAEYYSGPEAQQRGKYGVM